MRKFNVSLLAVLVVALCGICTYTVYAASKYTLNFKNTISFIAEDKIFYTAESFVYYTDQDENHKLATDNIDHGAYLSSQTPGKTQLNFNDNVRFTKDHNSLTYSVKIRNYTSQHTIRATIEVKNDHTYLINAVQGNTSVVLNRFTTTPTEHTFTIITTLNTNQSFEFENDIKITLETVD